jgi:hypothetical protein
MIEEDEYGDIIIHLGSPHVWLEGYVISLRIGPIRKETALERKAEDQVGATLVVTGEEREPLTEDVEVIIESLTPPEHPGIASAEEAR